MARSFHIGLAFSLSYEYARATMRGVISYARPSKPWAFQMLRPEGNGINAEDMRRCDGFVGTLVAPGVRAAVLATGKPAVNVSNGLKAEDIAYVGIDDVGVGRTAGDYFVKRGFRHFGFLGMSHADNYSLEREAGFREELQKSGLKVSAYIQWVVGRGGEKAMNFQQVQEWLRTLPRPVAVFCANDMTAWMLAEVCRDGGIAVPEEVSILGVDNDTPFCTAAYPTLSSIATPGERIGFEAAAMLDRMLMGRGEPPEAQRFPAKQVVTRHSSDTLALADGDVAMAVRFIRQHAGEQIGVEDVVAATQVARRSLERKFRAGLNCSPLDEIRRAHLERTRELLMNTDLTMPEIAGRSGFDSAVRMTTVFGEEMGMTPTQFRRQYRMRSGEEALGNDE